MKRWLTRYALSVVLMPLLIPAAAAEQDADASELSPLVVVANKIPRPIRDVAGTVHVIDADDQRRSLTQNLDQMLRYQPAINAERAGTRFGMTGINIRGIGNNRVAIEVDGVPQRDQFDIGSFSNAGRDLVESSLIRRVEVLNGPASTLYGSDAIGGVVAITTWDAQSLLARTRRSWHARLDGAYHGEDSSQSWSATAAAGNRNFGLLAAVTTRRGSELDNQAADTLVGDLQDWDSRHGHLQASWYQHNGNQLHLTANTYRRDRSSDIHSLLGRGRFRSTTALHGDDTDEQRGVSLRYEFGALAGFDSGRLIAHYQASDTVQRSRETRAAARTPVALQRDFYYSQDTAGLELNLFRGLAWGDTDHQLGLGLEYRDARTRELRDALQTTLATGAVTNHILSETFPLRDFPISDSTEWGLFVHDEIRWGSQRWTLIPALRIDHYSLSPRVDRIYREDHPDGAVVSLSDLAVSPKLGLVYRISDQWSGFAQYARGFRAPPFEDANIGLDIPLFNIRAIPNPDLKSETSNGLELGIRRWHSGGHFSLSAFATEYDDFIETKARIGLDPDTGTLLFQSRNIDQARIYGLELNWSQQLDTWSERLDGWRLQVAAHWARGDNRVSDVPLNTVSPPQAIAGLHWQSADGRFDTGLVGTFTRAQTRIDQTDGERFASPGYGIVDWLWGWQSGERVALRGGIFNLTDRKYWRWQDVSAFSPDDPAVEILSRPGRHAAVDLTVNF